MRIRSAVLPALLSILLLPAAASAQTFAVNTAEDVDLPAGCGAEPTCSLRDALAAAGSSSDEANVVSIPKGTYTLALGQLQANDSQLTIRGAGARQTRIDGGGASRVFEATGTDIVFEALTISGGSTTLLSGGNFPGDGGGVLLNSSSTTSVAFNQVSIVGNTAALNGGGIAAPPEAAFATTLTLNGSTVAGNKVSGGLGEGLGGGIATYGDLVLTNSTVAGNVVEDAGINAGGGVLAALDPSDSNGSAVTLLNSTIAGNAVNAGGMGGGISVDNPTAGVSTSFDIRNTIVAGNRVGNTEGDCFGIVAATSTNNLSGDASCAFADAGSLTNADPKLGTLADNGGETDTLKPAAGSLAIEAGTNQGCPSGDQRGVARPLGPSCDIGAVEQARETANPSADLALTLTAKPKKAKAGKKVTFTLKLANKGPGTAAGVTVSGSVPTAARKAKGTGQLPCKLAKPKTKKKKGKKRKAKSRGFSCAVGSLAAGQTLTLKLVVKKAPRKGKLKASAKVSATSADPSPGNDSAKAAVAVKKKKKR